MMGEVLTTVRATAAEVTAIKARLEVGTGRFEAMDERISAVEETQTDSRAAQTDTTAALAATRAHRLELLKAGSKYLIAAGLALATLMGKVTPEQLRAGLMKLAGI